MIWSIPLLLLFSFHLIFFFPLTRVENLLSWIWVLILPLFLSCIVSAMSVFCLDSHVHWGISSKCLHFSHLFKSWDITANPSCAGTEPEQHGASSISQFTAGGLCSQSGWVPLLDVHADTHQLCTCRRFYNCVFGRCSENNLLSASPDKVKTLFFCLPYIPSNTCLQLKASAEAYVKPTVTNLAVNTLQNNPHYPLL